MSFYVWETQYEGAAEVAEKVKLTQEQADAVERIKVNVRNEGILLKKIESPWETERNLFLNDMSLDEVVRLLYIGYEIEPEYEIGDWVVKVGGGKFIDSNVLTTTVIEVNTFNVRLRDGSGYFSFDYIRHATPEEIKAEKERRLWKSIGRKVGEFKKGDIRILDDGNSVRVIDVDYARAKYIQGVLKGFFPVESFISFEDGEGE